MPFIFELAQLHWCKILNVSVLYTQPTIAYNSLHGSSQLIRIRIKINQQSTIVELE